MLRFIQLALLPYRIIKALRRGDAVSVQVARVPEVSQPRDEKPDFSKVIAVAHMVCKTPEQKVAYVTNILEAHGYTGKVYSKGQAIMVSDLRPIQVSAP